MPTETMRSKLPDLAVVAQLEAHPVDKPGRCALSFDSACCSFDRVTPVTSTSSMAGEIERELAPAAADVEHLEAGLQVELGGDQAQLVLLGLLQRSVSSRK